MKAKTRNYLICLLVFITLLVFLNLFFIISMPGEGDYYIFPGEGRYEWLIAINLIFISILGCGILSIYLGISIFAKVFIKLVGKKNEVGIVPKEELSPKSHLIRLWGRGIILGFFISNLAFSLVSNEGVVTILLTPLGISSDIANYGSVQIPNASLMFQLIWILAIPCTFLLVPIWILMDVGLVSTKKEIGLEFSSVNRITAKIYKIIKGYAGIGFIYNLFVMIFDWVVLSKDTNPINLFAQIISPLAIISFTFPLIILIDYRFLEINKNVEKILIKLNMNKKLKSIIEVE